ncbi:MAG: aldo/keto reductase [Spirochaetia bacterium]|nr:aldo/keto reductase [Spirochaetia bacterium]
MKYRVLGKTGLSVSAFGVGAWQLGGPLLLDVKVDGHPDVGRDAAVGIMRAVFDLGVNLVDTAEQYGDGESERRVGEAVKGRRDKVFISTKFGARRGSQGERVNDASPGTIRTSLEGSLRRLGTDHVDIYLYHVPPKQVQHAEAFRILEDLKKEGKIRFHGISINSVPVLKQFIALGNLDVLQYNHNLLHPQEDVLEILRAENWGGLVRGAFAGGRLSGKYLDGKLDFHPDDVRRTAFEAARIKSEDFTRVRPLLELVPEGWTLPLFALRYVLDFPETHTILLGGKKISDYTDAFKALELPSISPELKKSTAEFSERLLQPGCMGEQRAKRATSPGCMGEQRATNHAG